GPIDGILVADERHRANLVGPMALLAVLLQDPRDVPGEGDGPILLRLDGASDDAALDLGDGDADRLAGQDFIERDDEVVAARLVAAVLVAKAIVDAASIDHLAAGEDKGFRCAFSLELVGDGV